MQNGQARKYLPGDVVDGAYQLRAYLGQGASGVVFECKHLVLGKSYAIKILSSEHIDGNSGARFLVEAKALAKLSHPGIVGIHNSGLDDGLRPYYVMDLLFGDTLDSVIAASAPIAVDRVLDLFIQVSKALAYAHEQGIIHRDIKPSNLVILRDAKNQNDLVKIVDFGIARFARQDLVLQSLTATGQIFGTPLYMSPEQCQGSRVDQRSDIYSLGCTLYETLTGSPPFRGENSFQTFLMHQDRPPPRLTDRAPQLQFSPALEIVIEKMLRKNINERYQTASQVEHDLERIKAGKEVMVRGIGKSADSTKLVALQSTSWQRESASQDDFDLVTLVPKKARLPLIVLLSLTLVPLFIVTGFHLSASPNKQTVKAHGARQKFSGDISPDDRTIGDFGTLGSLKRIGCTAKDIEVLQDYDGQDSERNQKHVRQGFALFLKEGLKQGSHFFSNDRSALIFPPTIIIGAVGFGHGKPIPATGTIKVPANVDICFYQNHCIGEDARFVELFAPSDLTGLELTVMNPRDVIHRIRAWKKLKELSFFNSLVKAMPGFQNFDESPITDQDLPEIDQFKGLEKLGLCGEKVSGAAVAKMALLDTLSGLRLKRIANIDALLSVLPEKSNLKELWLISQDTTDEQLEYLVQMNNLENLKIRRSQLTPKSLASFSRMKALKYLELDRNWTEAEKEKFRSAVPQCVFVPTVDMTYCLIIDDRQRGPSTIAK